MSPQLHQYIITHITFCIISNSFSVITNYCFKYALYFVKLNNSSKYIDLECADYTFSK